MANRYCGNCGYELSQEDRFCPNCGRPVHQTAYVPTPEADVTVPPVPNQHAAQNTVPTRRSTASRFLIGCVGVAIVLVLFVGCLSILTNGGDNSADSNPPVEDEGKGKVEGEKPQPAASEQADKRVDKQADENPGKIYGTGDEVRVGDVAYTVTEAQSATELTDTYKIDPPKTGDFIVVDFLFANNGEKPVNLSDIGLYLYDNKDRQYETDSEMFGYIPEEKDIFLLERINPGLTQEAQVVYSVPPDASGFELEVASGFFQSEVARIKLGEMLTGASASGQADTSGDVPDSVASLVSSYYNAVSREDWAATYSMLDSESQAVFTEDEWIQKQTTRNSAASPSPLTSAVVNSVSEQESEDQLANVTLSYDGGDQETLDVPIRLENGEYKRHLSSDDVTYLEAL